MDAEQLIKVCDDIVVYYDSTRGCGHTRAAASPSGRGDFAILTIGREQSRLIETTYGVACVEMERVEKLRGARLPLVLDNFTVRTLLAHAARFLAALTRENHRLGIALKTQQTINGDLRGENERLRNKVRELEARAEPGWAADPASTG